MRPRPLRYLRGRHCSARSRNFLPATEQDHGGNAADPVAAGNLLFGLSHKNKGQFFCLDASSGKTLWTGDPRQGENAAMLIAGNTIFSLTNDAELIVTSAANKAATPLKKYKVAGSATWAHPAISGKRILIKDENSLALLSLE